MPWSCLVSHSKPCPSYWPVHPCKHSKIQFILKYPSLLPLWKIYLPNFHPVLGPFSPANEISGCTMRQCCKKAMKKGKNENFTTLMHCRHIQRNFIFLSDLTMLHLQALSCPLIPIRCKKPYTRRIKSLLSYLPSPSGILPFEVFQVNNRFSPYQSLLLVHWLEDKDGNFIARLPLVHKDSIASFLYSCWPGVFID